MLSTQNFRDPLVSIIQSAAGADPVLLRAAEALGLGKQGDDPGVVEAKTLQCVMLAHDLLVAEAAGNAPEVARLRDELTFSTCDPGWAKVIIEYLDHARDPVPYVRAGAVGNIVLEMKPGATVALVGDWATGTDIAKTVLAEIATHQPDVLIHLGDIYYSGTQDETTNNFLAPIKVVLPDAQVLTLCGNHDVYSGGQGFYGLLRVLGQPASFFCLRSPDQRWQFCAMDTGKNDRDPLVMATNLTSIESDEEAWIVARITEFSGRTILLSHHQLFSALEPIGPQRPNRSFNPNLLASFKKFSLVGLDRIAAWFWGHEHAFSIYGPYLGLGRGRCLGHGAVPVFVGASPSSVGFGTPSLIGPALANDGSTYQHGFAIVRLGLGTVCYYQTGQAAPMFSESLDG